MITLIPLLLVLATPAVPAQDRIERADGRTVHAKLINPTLAEVIIASGDGKESKIPAADLLDIVPGPATDLMRQGESAFAKRDWSGAANAFSAASAETGGATWQPAWASLRQGEALLQWARADRSKAGEAAGVLRKWSEANAESFWLPRARLAEARALVIAGDVEGATGLLQALSDLAFQRGLAKHLELEINLERCRAFMAGNQYDVAGARLQDLVTKDPPADAPRGVRSRMLALRGEAQILLGDAIAAKSGQGAATAYWEGLARDTKASSDVRAAALVGLATTARAAGKLREAQLQLAEVVAVLNAGEEVLARALWELAEVTAQLGDHPVPAKTYYARILRDCPDSSYAEKAKAKVD
jgi:hypothetical protein